MYSLDSETVLEDDCNTVINPNGVKNTVTVVKTPMYKLRVFALSASRSEDAFRSWDCAQLVQDREEEKSVS